jgi:glycosyltransferase involved in cell wall biosynthesis
MDNIKSLAFITSQAFSISNFRGSLIRELIEKGITVYALAPDFDDVSRSAVTALGALPLDSSLSRAGMNPIRDFFDTCRLSRQLAQLKLDATFAYFIKPTIYGSLAAWVAGVRNRFAMIEGAGYVFNEQQGQKIRGRILRKIVIWLYSLALRHVHRVFLLNRDDRQLFSETGMVDANKVVLLNGIGVDLDFFSVRAPVIQPICFLMIARLLREKGVYEYVDAARIVKSSYPDVRFLLLGTVDVNPGSLSQSEIDEWVAENVIESPGHVSDVRPWLEQASVFVLPSYREGLPRSTQEAMAMGRPVITTDAVGCRDTVEERVNGFKVPVGNAKAIAEAMLVFIRQPDLIRSMGAMSRQMAEKNYDVKKINKLILSEMAIS